MIRLNTYRLIVLYSFASSLFIVSFALHPYPLSFAIKALPILLLAAFVIRLLPGPGVLLSVAFVFSAGGDIVLDLDRQNLFVLGLGLFLVTHLIYGFVFSRQLQFSRPGLLLSAGLFLFCSVMTMLLWPKLAELKVPVLFYIAVITTMGCFCFFFRKLNRQLLFGVLLFIASDSVIAINKFLHPFDLSRYVIMITYYGGQLLIALGFVRAFGEVTEENKNVGY